MWNTYLILLFLELFDRFRWVSGRERRRMLLDIVSPGVQGNYTASSITLSGPALNASVTKLRGLFPLIDISHTYLYDPSIGDCTTFQNQVQNILARWYYTERRKDSAVLIVTPGCIESAQINPLAAAWNVLFISTANSGPDIRDNTKSPTWLTTNLFPSAYYGDVFTQLVLRCNWTSVEVLLDLSSTGFYTQASTLTRAALLKHGVSALLTSYASARESFNFHTYLDDFSTRNRVLLFYGSPTQLRLLLITAVTLNMTNGEYVYISARSFNWAPYGTYRWNISEPTDEIVREAYSSFLRITMVDLTLSIPPNVSLTGLQRIWDALYVAEPFFENTNMYTAPPLPMLTSATAAMDIYAQALNELLTDDPDFDIGNGSALALHIINRTYETSVGEIFLDIYGERKPFMATCAYFNQTTRKFKAFLRSTGHGASFEWGDVIASPLRWHNGSELPPSFPRCGYDGSRCQETSYLSYWVLLICLIVILNVVAAWYIIRNRRVLGIDSSWWRLDEVPVLTAEIKLFSKPYYFDD